MKKILLSIALAMCSAPLFAGEPCGVAGVTVAVTPAVALPGELITATLTNNSGQTITFPTSCLFQAVDTGQVCGNTIAGFFCLAVLTDIPPGGTLVQSWNQEDDFSNQVPAGDYSFKIRYFDSSFSSFECCVNFRIADDPGTPFCFGAGCPCGNEGGTDEGCQNSTGSGAQLSGSGQAIVGNDTMVLNIAGAPANKPGLFFGGPTELAPLPFGDGLRCVGGALVRIEVVFTDASGNASTGTSISTAEGLTGGELRQYQFWYRDNSSVCGAAFNISNAYRVNW